MPDRQDRVALETPPAITQGNRRCIEGSCAILLSKIEEGAAEHCWGLARIALAYMTEVQRTKFAIHMMLLRAINEFDTHWGAVKIGSNRK